MGSGTANHSGAAVHLIESDCWQPLSAAGRATPAGGHDVHRLARKLVDGLRIIGRSAVGRPGCGIAPTHLEASGGHLHIAGRNDHARLHSPAAVRPRRLGACPQPGKRAPGAASDSLGFHCHARLGGVLPSAAERAPGVEHYLLGGGIVLLAPLSFEGPHVRPARAVVDAAVALRVDGCRQGPARHPLSRVQSIPISAGGGSGPDSCMARGRRLQHRPQPVFERVPPAGADGPVDAAATCAGWICAPTAAQSHGRMGPVGAAFREPGRVSKKLGERSGRHGVCASGIVFANRHVPASVL